MSKMDKKLEKFDKHLSGAIKCLSSIVVDECDGSEDLLEECYDTIKETMLKLIDIKKNFIL